MLDVTFNVRVGGASRREAALKEQMPVGFARFRAPENLGLLRRFCVNLLKREPSNLSLAMKRYKAGLENEFLLKILAASAPT